MAIGRKHAGGRPFRHTHAWFNWSPKWRIHFGAIETVGTNFTELANRITEELAGLSPRFDALDTKIDQRLSPESSSKQFDAGRGPDELNVSALNSGLGAALYAVRLMEETGKHFEPRKANLPDRFSDYIGGVLSAFSFVKPFGTEIEKKGKYTFILNKLAGPLNEYVLDAEHFSKVSDRLREALDAYFGEKEAA